MALSLKNNAGCFAVFTINHFINKSRIKKTGVFLFSSGGQGKKE